MLKEELRSKYLKLRSTLSPAEVSEKSIQIANEILKLPIWDFQNYHIFLPIDKKTEINTEGIISVLQGFDKNVIVPKIISQTSLAHYLLTDNTKFKVNRLGIPEPEDGITVDAKKIDVVFVPLLAFDKKGNRTGYGKGYYDRFLLDCRPDVLKIGLSFFEAETSIDDISPSDIPLDYCINPLKTYSFKTS